jgi:hypothetical protein
MKPHAAGEAIERESAIVCTFSRNIAIAGKFLFGGEFSEKYTLNCRCGRMFLAWFSIRE